MEYNIETLCHELHFATLSDMPLISVINNSMSFFCENLANLEYNPFLIDDKYNTDLNVNEFYMRNRAVKVPKSDVLILITFKQPKGNV